MNALNSAMPGQPDGKLLRCFHLGLGLLFDALLLDFESLLQRSGAARCVDAREFAATASSSARSARHLAGERAVFLFQTIQPLQDSARSGWVCARRQTGQSTAARQEASLLSRAIENCSSFRRTCAGEYGFGKNAFTPSCGDALRSSRVRVGADHDDRGRRRASIRAHPPDHFEAVHARHIQIGDDRPATAPRCRRIRSASTAGGGHQHRHPGIPMKCDFQRRRAVFGVLDDQDGARHPAIARPSTGIPILSPSTSAPGVIPVNYSSLAKCTVTLYGTNR